MSIEFPARQSIFVATNPEPPDANRERNTSPAPGAVYARDPATEASRLQTVTLLVTHFTHITRQY